MIPVRGSRRSIIQDDVQPAGGIRMKYRFQEEAGRHLDPSNERSIGPEEVQQSARPVRYADHSIRQTYHGAGVRELAGPSSLSPNPMYYPAVQVDEKEGMVTCIHECHRIAADSDGAVHRQEAIGDCFSPDANVLYRAESVDVA